MKKTIVYILCIIFALFPLFHSLSEGTFLQNPDAIEDAIRSMLFIVVFDENSEVIGLGSGFIAFDSRTVITNHHVIKDADFIMASDENDIVYKIDRIIAFDEEKDIAILSIEGDTSLIPLELAENTTLKRGQPVLTIGSPEGLKNSVSNGIISAIYNRNDTPDIQFTAPISHGSSGGALFDDKGRVIGITSAIHKEGQNINFAVGIYHVVDLYRKYNPAYINNASMLDFTPGISLAPTQKPESIPKLMPPTNLRAYVFEKFIKLMWLTVDGATEYTIYRSNTQNGTYMFIASSTSTTYNDSNILLGTTYYYKVSATNKSAIESEKSEFYMVSTVEATAKPTPIPTPKPTPTSTPTSTPAPISLIGQDEISNYKTLTVGMNDNAVARLKERMYELGYFTNKTVNNRFTETTAEYVKEFQRVNGLKVDGIASPEMQALFFSEYAIPKPGKVATAKPTIPPKAPTGLRVDTSTGYVVLSWPEVKDAIGYQIYRANSAKGKYDYLAITTKPTFTDKSSVRGKTYYYKVASVFDNKANSDKSNYAKAVMPKPTPAPYVEPKYPIDFGNDGYTGTSRNPYLNPKIINISKTKTVDGFTLIYYCTDVYGSKLFFDDTRDYTSVYTYTNKIGPGRSTYPGKVSLNLYGSGIKRVYVAISKIHTTDGKTYNVPESQLSYYYWELD